jgi:hypothetical protein
MAVKPADSVVGAGGSGRTVLLTPRTMHDPMNTAPISTIVTAAVSCGRRRLWAHCARAPG